MRKLIESTLVSLDGVIESPEQWAIFDEEATQRSMQELDNYDAFVLGRVTYERFPGHRHSDSGAQGAAWQGPHQVRQQPPRRHAPTRAAHRRAPRMDHASRRWQRAAHLRGHRQLLAQPHAHQGRPASQRLRRPHLHR